MELGRFELPSKRGNHKLSTCLSSPSIFELKQDRSHQLEPYPLKFRKGNEAYLNYSRFNCATEPKCFGKTAFEWRLVSAPSTEIKPDLLYFDQAARAYSLLPDKLLITEIIEQIIDALHAYSSFLPAVKSSQPHITSKFRLIMGNRAFTSLKGDK